MKKLRLMILPIWLILFVVVTMLTGSRTDAHTLTNKELLTLDSTVLKANEKEKSIRLNNKKDSIYELLKSEIDAYIDNNAKKNHNISGPLIDNAMKYDLDICFMMAQAEQETCYGNTGIGRTNKSMFGVISRSYRTYRECIEDYSCLIRTSYLGKRKTEKHLMVNFVSLGGYRYASDKRYESSIKARYKKIKSSTDIDKYQKELEMLI